MCVFVCATTARKVYTGTTTASKANNQQLRPRIAQKTIANRPIAPATKRQAETAKHNAHVHGAMQVRVATAMQSTQMFVNSYEAAFGRTDVADVFFRAADWRSARDVFRNSYELIRFTMILIGFY